jgi:hypothetical protein
MLIERLPALTDLENRLKIHRIDADASDIASVILDLASVHEWQDNEWISQLALDTLHARAGNHDHAARP